MAKPVLFYKYSITDVVRKFVFGTSPSQLWFLLMLIDVFLIFWLLSDFMSRNHIWGAVVTIAFYGLGIVGSKYIPNVFMIWTACSYIPLFWFGFKLRECGTNWIRKVPPLLWLIIDVILFLINQFISSQSGMLFKIMSLGSSFVLHIVGAIMVFIVLQWLADRIKWDNKYFNFFSKRSMAVYLFHQQVYQQSVRM